MVRKTRLEFFSEERIRLDREIQHHPELVTILENQVHKDFEVRIAEVAAYLGIILEGDYLPEDLDRLCGIMCNKLMEKRSNIIMI